MKQLFIIRHAKSSWASDKVKDFDRPLNERGFRDAPLMGGRLSEAKIIPNLIISSTANRAITTAGLIAKAVNYPTDQIERNENIYYASVPELVKIVNAIDDSVETAFIIGHNPNQTELAEYFCDDAFGSMPTCGILGVEFSVDRWAHITAGSGVEIYYDFPKNER